MDEHLKDSSKDLEKSTSDQNLAAVAEDTSASEHGVVLGVWQGSCMDRLPEDIKRRREEFLRQQEQEAKRSDADGIENNKEEEQVTARFASRLKRVKQLTASKPKKKFSKQNFQAILVCIVLFIAYIGYNEFFKPDDTTMSLEDLQARLPMPIDNTTALVKAYEDEGGLFIEFKKKASEYENLSENEANERKDAFLSRAHSLCRNELFNKYVRSGKVLHVSLNADDGQAVRTITVDQCPVVENTR